MKNDEIIPAPFSPSDANYPSNSVGGADRDPGRRRHRQIELFHPCMNTFATVLGRGRGGGWGEREVMNSRFLVATAARHYQLVGST